MAKRKKADLLRVKPGKVPSDLDSLRDWADRIGGLVEGDDPPNRHWSMIFRAPETMADTLMRLGTPYPEPIRQIGAFLDHTEERFSMFLRDRTDAAADGFGEALQDLQGRIRAAADAILAARDTNSADISKLFPGGAPDDPDIRDLVVALDAGKSGTKSQNAIARKFMGETADHDPRSQTLLHQIRRMKRRGEITL